MASSRISAALSAASWSSTIAPKTACSASLLHGAWRPAYSPDRSAVEEASGDTDVIPGWSLPVGVSQQRGRVIRDDHGDAAEPVDLIAECAEGLFGVEQTLRGRPAHGQNDFRLDQLDLPVEVRQARRDFVVLREPVLRRPAFHDVADEHLVPRQLDRLEDLREQLARSSHKWTARGVFRLPRPFADHHESRVRRTFARDGVGAPVAQLALVARGDEGGDILETTRLLDRVGGEEVGRRWIE